MGVVQYQRTLASTAITASLNSTITHIAVGSGTTTPVIGDTTLSSEDYREVKFSSLATSTKYQVSVRLDVTENNGNTINEWGAFNAGSGGTMYFRNLTTAFAKTSSNEAYYRMALTFTFSDS